MAKTKITNQELYKSFSRQGWRLITSAGAVSTEDDAVRTYNISFNGVDLSWYLYPGVRFYCEQGGVPKYGIVTKIDYREEVTTATIFLKAGSALDIGEIANPQYSFDKAPFMFSLDPTDWSVIVTDASPRTFNGTTGGQWYNPGSLKIDVPVGAWNLYYRCALWTARNASAVDWGFATLSTTNNSDADSDFRVTQYWGSGLGSSMTDLIFTMSAEKNIIVTAKTPYYLLISGASGLSTLSIRGEQSKTIIRAVCAYL